MYRQALRQEAAAADGLASAVILDDLESFFETINRAALVEEAQRLNFPMVILRASLAAYVGPRMLTLDGRAAKEMYARDGTLPGCTCATTYVKVFYLRRLDSLVERLPAGVELDIYIDGEEVELATKMVEAREALREVITKGLGCRIAAAKSCIVASSGKLSKHIARRLGMDQAVRRCAPNLGVDTTGGGRRRIIRVGGSRRKARFRNCRKRGKNCPASPRPSGPGR